MEWEGHLIEQMQYDLGGFGSFLGKAFSCVPADDRFV